MSEYDEIYHLLKMAGFNITFLIPDCHGTRVLLDLLGIPMSIEDKDSILLSIGDPELDSSINGCDGFASLWVYSGSKLVDQSTFNYDKSRILDFLSRAARSSINISFWLFNENIIFSTPLNDYYVITRNGVDINESDFKVEMCYLINKFKQLKNKYREVPAP